MATVILFQAALILGAPWGEYTMGGIYPGKLPARMRAAAGVQIVILLLFASIAASRAGIALAGFPQCLQNRHLDCDGILCSGYCDEPGKQKQEREGSDGAYECGGPGLLVSDSHFLKKKRLNPGRETAFFSL